ncbi:MAG: hypothetical protein N2C12_11100, partial [Planctomycetales bacterium]
TGYRDAAATRVLGYATSPDGLNWTRHADGPIFDESWVEDMHVVKHGDEYIMVAEGRNDIAHMLTSENGIDWEDHGSLDVRTTDGEPLSKGPYGTPTLWIENDTWYLFYERGDRGVWLARSDDRKIWTNVQDEPVLKRGPESYDLHAIALTQVIKIGDHYYAIYLANSDSKWRANWTTNIAVSEDLVHWTKYSNNPILAGDYSSSQLIHDGKRFRLYSAHPDLRVYFPRGQKISTDEQLPPDTQFETASAHMARGITRFKKNEIAGSLRDFNRAAEMDPDSVPRLWQRGISQYYAQEYGEGRKQFETHRQANPHDVENATWHFICVARDHGIQAARHLLIPINTRHDTRVPMIEIYEFYAGRGSAQAVLNAADSAGTDSAAMYAHLYLGLFYEVTGQKEKARQYIREAVATNLKDHYMHDVARIHLLQRDWAE